MLKIDITKWFLPIICVIIFLRSDKSALLKISFDNKNKRKEIVIFKFRIVHPITFLLNNFYEILFYVLRKNLNKHLKIQNFFTEH